jgi:hypothetical protein
MTTLYAEAAHLDSRSLRATEPLGVMAARLAILLLLCEAIGLWLVVEQPKGSLLFYHPRLQGVLRKVTVYKHLLYQWDFGAMSSKPTWLFSNRSWISDIDKHKVFREDCLKESLVQTRTRADGSTMFQGNRNTKQSQHYPLPFGVAVARIYREHGPSLKQQYDGLVERINKYAAGKDDQTLLNVLNIALPKGREGWQDANLDVVLQLLSTNLAT